MCIVPGKIAKAPGIVFILRGTIIMPEIPKGTVFILPEGKGAIMVC